ncbi:PP2C family serine/threonine-protein phosphatase [Kribbella sp. NPDC051586]|uniref:PP2C family serine/threonine-protein phosphatase n=1 Tax=Kribbella sp. NPDC051586 TaxID=3364118 RepID=UPI0037AD95E3
MAYEVIRIGSAVVAGAKVNEDSASARVDNRSNSALLIVSDGASGLSDRNLTDCESEAQWLARGITDHFDAVFPEFKDISTELVAAVASMRNSTVGQLLVSQEGIDPTAAISIVHLIDDVVHIGSLGDCPILVQFRTGEIRFLPGDRKLSALDESAISYLRDTARARHISPRQARTYISNILLENRQRANHHDGYWIADLSGAGLPHLAVTTYAAAEIRRVVVMSDGFRIGVGRGRPFPTWHSVLTALDNSDLPGMLKQVKSALLADPEWVEYPRISLCDDLSLAYLDLSEAY